MQQGKDPQGRDHGRDQPHQHHLRGAEGIGEIVLRQLSAAAMSVALAEVSVLGSSRTSFCSSALW